MKCKCLMVILFLLLGWAPAGLAAEAAGEEDVSAIQNRIFDRYHEIGVPVGFIPDDDFYYDFPVGVSYTYNFNENWAWEVARGQWVINAEKDLKDDLESDFGITPSEFDKIKFTVHSNLILKPSYGKDALWNKYIINHETYLLAGGGIVYYERETSTGEESSETAPSLSLGVGRKYFLNDKFCLNLEVRDLVNFKDEGVENNVYLGVGLGFRFDLGPRRPMRETSVDRFKGYIEEK